MARRTDEFENIPEVVAANSATNDVEEVKGVCLPGNVPDLEQIVPKWSTPQRLLVSPGVFHQPARVRSQTDRELHQVGLGHVARIVGFSPCAGVRSHSSSR